MAWAEPPEGRAGWTLRLLADRLVEWEVVESISPETVRQTLKETNSRPRSATGQALAERVLADPAEGSAEFVCAMEDVLEVYHRQYGGKEVLVCLDETSKQLVKETRQPRPARPGMTRTYDYEYQRKGVSKLFMLFAPLVRAVGRVAAGGSHRAAYQS